MDPTTETSSGSRSRKDLSDMVLPPEGQLTLFRIYQYVLNLDIPGEEKISIVLEDERSPPGATSAIGTNDAGSTSNTSAA